MKTKFYIVTFLLPLLSISTLSNEWRNSNCLTENTNRDEAIQVRELINSNDQIVFEYKFPLTECRLTDSKVRSQKACKVKVGNCQQISIPGKPILPIIPARIVIPYGKKINKIFLSDFSSKLTNLEYPIAYGKNPILLDQKADIKETSLNAAIYNTDKPFPERNYELISIQKKCGVSIAIINFYPVTYIPKSKQLISHLNFQVNITLENDSRSQYRELTIRPDRVIPKELNIENPDAIKTYPQMPASIPSKGTIASTRDNAEYLIIATDKIIKETKSPSLNDLLQYRKNEGFTGRIVSYESIISGTGSKDIELRMRNFLTDAYNNWGTKYVFLAGSYRQGDSYIKNKDLHYMVVPEATSGGGYQRTDIYYECLDGSYNHDTTSTPDSKKRFGEWTDGEDGGIPDFFAELHIGRLMALTPEDVSNAIYKMLEYEKSNGQYKSEVLLAGEALFPSIKAPNKHMWYAKKSMMAVWDGGNDAGNITQGLSKLDGVNLTTMFDADTCNNAPTPKFPDLAKIGWEADQMIEKINSNKFGIINHLGHGNEEHGLDMDVTKHTEQLTNTNFPFLYTQACLNAGFMYKQTTSRSFSRHLTAESRNYGIAGGVFNMNLGYSPFSNDIEIYGPSERMNLQFWDAYVSEGMRRAGELHTDSHEDNINFINEHHIKYCIYITTLLADPAMKINIEDSSTPITITGNAIDKKRLNMLSILKVTNSKLILQIPQNGIYNIKFFSINGKLISSVSSALKKGKQHVNWKGNNLANGMYILKVIGNKRSIEKKFILSK